MRKPLTLLFGLGFGILVLSSAQAQVPTQILTFPQMAVGDGWETELTLFAQGQQDSFGIILFLFPEGEELPVSVNGSEPVSAVAYDLAAGTAQSFLLTREGGAQSGYILVFEGDDEFSSGSISGTVTYRLREGGDLLNQVGVTASRGTRQADLPFDNQNGNRSAIAMLVFDETDVVFDWFDQDGTLMDSEERFFADFEQSALFVDELFPGSTGNRGVVRIRSQEDLFTVALDLNDTLLSSSQAIPSVIERRVLVQFDDDDFEGTLRLFQEDLLVFGVVEFGSELFLVSGAVFPRLSGGFHIQLTIHASEDEDSQDVPLTGINLVAVAPDRDLIDVEGNFIAHGAAGDILATGPFQISGLD